MDTPVPSDRRWTHALGNFFRRFDCTVSLLRKLLLKKAKMLNVQTAVWFKKAKISNFHFEKRRKLFSYHPRKGF